MKTRYSRLALALLLLLLVVPLGCSTNQSDEWEKLNQESLTLLDQGKYDRGVSVAQAALQLAEKRFGPTSSETATSLNNLGLLYVKPRQVCGGRTAP